MERLIHTRWGGNPLGRDALYKLTLCFGSEAEWLNVAKIRGQGLRLMPGLSWGVRLSSSESWSWYRGVTFMPLSLQTKFWWHSIKSSIVYWKDPMEKLRFGGV